MSQRFEYTTLAQSFTARFPLVAYVGTQVTYWTIANLLLITIVNLLSQIIAAQYKLPVPVSPGSLMLVAVILGIICGVSFGVSDYYLDRKFFRKLPLGKVILIKAFGSLALLFILLFLLRFVLFGFLIAPSLDARTAMLSEESWRLSFYLLLVYYFFMTLIINFVNQVNKKYGPGVLAPLLLGRYRDPKEEDRIFMFMDLKSSTTRAEQLGHMKYSAFIRDCFADINKVLFPFRAQVYQYVGDEIVVTWPIHEGVKNHFCIRFYFACSKQFRKRAEYYKLNYGQLPEFKAGVHMGKVTAVEIGEIKKDIAYHGDTLNTAARIQGVCNGYKKDLIISEYVLDGIGMDPCMKVEMLGMILLRGKTEKIGIVSVDWVESGEKTS
ncbi:adenylate cyclase [Algoriphagus sp. 4150]|uniref:adenylate/guanylate cyclase domain-containing protein n=1 Tax=Algoriphagus sp. 4150 TaxID=2817756 RepID=UPI00285FBEF5|nr:adenylate/guanylate cyclase domain-containing protein [Algoriphagus sp. 4150]MDR7129779.1 adenylate cyclase [Algoriphagus sp. 4150]